MALAATRIPGRTRLHRAYMLVTTTRTPGHPVMHGSYTMLPSINQNFSPPRSPSYMHAASGNQNAWLCRAPRYAYDTRVSQTFWPPSTSWLRHLLVSTLCLRATAAGPGHTTPPPATRRGVRPLTYMPLKVARISGQPDLHNTNRVLATTNIPGH